MTEIEITSEHKILIKILEEIKKTNQILIENQSRLEE